MSDGVIDPGGEELLAALDQDGEAALVADRSHCELLGLLALAPEPGTLAAGARDRLLERVASESAPLVFPATTARPARAPWRLPLAAALLLGLGLSAAVALTVAENRRLVQRLAAAEEALERAGRSLASAELALAGTHDRLSLVTDLGTAICSLRPPAEGGASSARGVLWVAADHQHWHLTIEGLEQVESRVFELWFLVGDEGRPVSAGRFAATDDGRIELGSPEMPHDTRAVAVTLEPSATRAAGPQGPMVLFGNELVQMI